MIYVDYIEQRPDKWMNAIFKSIYGFLTKNYNESGRIDLGKGKGTTVGEASTGNGDVIYAEGPMPGAMGLGPSHGSILGTKLSKLINYVMKIADISIGLDNFGEVIKEVKKYNVSTTNDRTVTEEVIGFEQKEVIMARPNGYLGFDSVMVDTKRTKVSTTTHSNGKIEMDTTEHKTSIEV